MPTDPLTETQTVEVRPDAEPQQMVQQPHPVTLAIPRQGAVAGVAADATYLVLGITTLLVIGASGIVDVLAKSAGTQGTSLPIDGPGLSAATLSMLPAMAA